MHKEQILYAATCSIGVHVLCEATSCGLFYFLTKHIFKYKKYFSFSVVFWLGLCIITIQLGSGKTRQDKLMQGE